MGVTTKTKNIKAICTKEKTPSPTTKLEIPPMTPQEVFDDVKARLNIAKSNLERTPYLDLLVRISDEVQDRMDAVNEDIGKDEVADRD